MEKATKASLMCNAIRKKIVGGEWPHMSKLPSVSRLAKTFGVSRSLVFSGLDQLEKEGYILRSERSGIYVKNESASEPDHDFSPSLSVPRAMEIADAIALEISNGTHRVGNCLPQQKSLQFQYHTSSNSVTEALRILQSRGLVSKMGARFVVGVNLGIVGTRKRQQVLLAGDWDLSRRWPLTDNHRVFFHTFEEELGKQGVSSLEFVSFKEGTGVSLNHLANSNVIGFLFHVSPHATVEKIMRDIQHLSSTGLPVALFDEYDLSSRMPAKQHKFPRNVFPITGGGRAKQCEKSGAYLASLGHKRIGFFSLSNEPWSQIRLEGLEKGFLGGKVEKFYADTSPESLLEHCEKDPQKKRAAFASAIAGIFNGHRFLRPEALDRLLVFTQEEIRLDWCRTCMAPAFEKGFLSKEISAWVTADPSLAVAALDFLETKSVRLPGDLSLLSLDNNDFLALLGITAFDLQMGRAGYLAAHCLLEDVPVSRDSHARVVPPSMVVERRTTGRA